jgi:Flp pilus assembly protein TadG
MGTGESGCGSGGAAGRRGAGLFRLTRRFGSDRRGATMIEFSLLMLPFFILLFGIFEVGLVIWGGLELDNATSDASRLVRTGQAQAGKYDSAKLRQEVCSHVALLFDCNSRLKVAVETFAGFANMSAPQPLDDKGSLKPNFSYDMGGPEDVVLMSTFYEWPLLNIISSMSLSNMASGNYLLRSAAAFRNEPFPE